MENRVAYKKMCTFSFSKYLAVTVCDVLFWQITPNSAITFHPPQYNIADNTRVTMHFLRWWVKNIII